VRMTLLPFVHPSPACQPDALATRDAQTPRTRQWTEAIRCEPFVCLSAMISMRSRLRYQAARVRARSTTKARTSFGLDGRDMWPDRKSPGHSAPRSADPQRKPWVTPCPRRREGSQAVASRDCPERQTRRFRLPTRQALAHRMAPECNPVAAITHSAPVIGHIGHGSGNDRAGSRFRIGLPPAVALPGGGQGKTRKPCPAPPTRCFA
jgi:hypothetical protein